MICLVQIPQRFMTVNGLSSVDAAICLLAFGAFVPSGSTFAALLIGKFKIPPCFILLAGAVLQLIGSILLSRIPSSSHIHTEQYGYQILLGLGIGFVACGLIMLVPLAMEQKDLGKSHQAVNGCKILICAQRLERLLWRSFVFLVESLDFLLRRRSRHRI
jgi:hypothetical protein